MADPSEDDLNHQDERRADLLVAYDSALLANRPPADGTPAPLDKNLDLAQDIACLELLHRVWGPGGSGSASAGASPAATSSPGGTQQVDIPRRIGRFQVLRELGRGGYGVVLLAVDPNLDRRVAIKIPRPEVLVSPTLRDRFLREAEAAGRLDHPNLVPVFEVGEDGPLWYIASAYMPDGTLTEWAATLPEGLEPRGAALLVAHLADAVQHAHSAGILHRDIKPGNVLMQSVGEASGSPSMSMHAVLGYVPRLTDFGLAKLLDSDCEQTASGALLGTPSYMAPEQATGKLAEVGTATDVYGLGAILYELLTGRPPFRAGNSIETLRQVVQDEVAPPRRLRRQVDRDLQAICLKCLEKRRADRYQTARELAVDLRHYLAGEPTDARTPTSSERLVKWCRRKPALAGLVTLSLAATVLLIGGLAWSNLRIAREAKIAEGHRRQAQDLYYSAAVRLAQQAFNDGDYGGATSLLAQQIPADGDVDRREFAWRSLWSALHRQQAQLPKHPAEVYGVSFSPDGTRLATACADGRARLWAHPKGTLLATLKGHTGEVNIATFSPDGSLLATGGDDGRLILRGADDLKVRHVFPHTWTVDEQGITAAVFSPTGDRLYTAYESRVAMWDVETGECLLTADHGRQIEDVALSADGQMLALIGGSVDFLTADWLEPLHSIEADGDALYSSGGFLPLDRMILGDRLGRLAVFNILTGDRLDRIRTDFDSAVLSIAISPDETRLVASSRGRSIAVFEVDSWTHITSFAGHSDRVWNVAFSPDSKAVASAGGDGQVMVWSSPTSHDYVDVSGYEERAIWKHAVDEIAYSRDEQLAGVASGGAITIFDRTAGQQLRLPCASSRHGSGLAFSPDGRSLLVRRLQSLIEVWSVATGELMRSLKFPGSLTRMALSPRGDRLVLGVESDDGSDRLVLLEWPSARQLRVLDFGNDAAAAVHFAPSSDLLLIGRPAVLSAYDARTLDSVYQVKCPAGQSVVDIAFFADGSRMATAESEGGVAIRDLRTGQVLDRLAGLSGSISGVAVTPDGRNLASIGSNEVVRIWDLVTDQCLMEFERMPPMSRGGLTFNPSGDELWLAIGGRTGILAVWSGGRTFSEQPPVASAPQRALSANWPRAFGGQRVVQTVIPGQSTAYCWSPTSEMLLVADNRGNLSTFDPAADRRPKQLAQQLGSRAVSVDFDAAGEQVLTVEESGAATWWNQAGQVVASFEIKPGARSAQLSPAKDRLLYWTDQWLAVVDAVTGEVQWSYHEKIMSSFVHADWASDDTIAVSFDDGRFWMIRASDSGVINETIYPQPPLNGFSPPHANSPLAAEHDGHGIRLMDPRSGEELTSFDTLSGSMHWAGDGKLLLLRNSSWFDLFDIAAGKVMATFPAIRGGDFVVSPDGTKAAILNYEQINIVWLDHERPDRAAGNPQTAAGQ